MSDTKRPAVGYVRMSSDQQQDSPARQRRDVQALADRLGYRIIKWYEDHGMTGTESSKRREFQKLLADAKAGTFCAVLLSEQSRMSREDIFDCMQHWRLFRDAGVAIVTCQRGELKFDNLGGVITAIVDQYGAREESLKLADRVVSGKRLAVSKGQKQGGALFGYDREILDEAGRVVRRVSCRELFRKPINWSSRLVLASDPQAVEAVRIMFESVGDGAAYGSVARDLNRRGFTTMFGKRFNASSVRRAVSNPAYAGKIVAGRKRRGKFRSLHDDGGVVCDDAHEPLVSREAFERAQRVIRRKYRAPKAPTPGRYLLTGILYLADGGQRLQGFTMSHSGRKVVRRYYGLPARCFEERPEDSDRPTFRADTIERAVLAKLQQFMSDERTKRAIRSEISRRTKKAEANVGRYESQLAEVRAKIERGTENLALASRKDIPGISRLLAGWREQEAQIKEQLQRACGDHAPSPEALAVIGRLDELLGRLTEADREKLAFAIRQTVKRVTLRRERRKVGRHRITIWDGVIELRDDLGVAGVIPLTDDDIPSPGRWRDAARFVHERGDVVYVQDVADALGVNKAFASTLLAKAVLSGKVRNLGHQKGWTAAE
ncbi:MAG: recombinase family protein [Planctomycetes bacterium]|nr:recombinase family protein [Planctomycetota bacterium]